MPAHRRRVLKVSRSETVGACVMYVTSVGGYNPILGRWGLRFFIHTHRMGVPFQNNVRASCLYQLSRICLHLLQPGFIIIFSVWPRVRLVRAAGRVSCLPPDRGRTQPPLDLTPLKNVFSCHLNRPEPPTRSGTGQAELTSSGLWDAAT